MAGFPNFLYLKVTHFSVIRGGFVWNFQLPATEGSPADTMTLLKQGTEKRRQCWDSGDTASHISPILLLDMGMHSETD